MKKLKLLVMVFLSLLILPSLVNAASGTISISGTSTVVVGNKVTLTVTLSSGTAIGSWEMQLNYDKNYLELTSTNSEAGGNRMSASSATGIKSKKYTFTFKAKKTGATNLSIGSYLAYAFSDMSEISLTGGSKTIKIITQEELEASYSKDNNLKSLSVEGYELSPEFNKDTLNYSVTVPEGTTNVKINAEKNDSKASISGDGEVNVTEGANNIQIVVRAENGSEKTYTITVNVIDENPINVTAEGKNYTVIKIRSNYECPELFTDTEVTINDTQIPACFNDKTNYTLVGLKLDDGTVENFIYDNGKYTKYREIVGTSLKIIILDYKDEVKGLEKFTAKINDKEYNVFRNNENAKNYIVYGMNVETGEKNFYIYDLINKTFALYNTDELEDANKLNDIYLYIILAFICALLLSFISIIIQTSKTRKLVKKLKAYYQLDNSKEDNKNIEENKIVQEDNIEEETVKKKKNKKEKKSKEQETTEEVEENKTEEINKITEIKNNEEDDETETYYLFESDRKRSKKRKEKERRRELDN